MNNLTISSINNSSDNKKHRQSHVEKEKGEKKRFCLTLTTIIQANFEFVHIQYIR